MYPPSMTRNGHRYVISRSNGHGLTQVLGKIFGMDDSRGGYFP
jgi:hypothetical protein